MSAKGVSERKMKEILRLYYDAQLSMHQIARSLKLSSGVVYKHISRLKAAGITWPVPDNLSDKDLTVLGKNKIPHTEKIDFQATQKELKRTKSVTLQLLWEEYKDACLTSLSYSQFCRRFNQWKSKQPQSMKQNHKAGDKTFVDYSGQTFDIIDAKTGQIRAAQIFIGVLGASNYTYAEASWTQRLEDWIRSHIRMFEYFGGVSALIVPDNLKSAVHKTCRYEPDINPTYAAFITHYNTAVLPARPYKPKDKAKAEGGVLLVQRWILASLRHETYIGLDDLNESIRKLLNRLNNKPFKKISGSRRSLFEEIEKSALKPLPKTQYEYKHYKRAKVHIDYHFELDRHYYSVPHTYIGERLDIWHNQYIVKAFVNGACIASHQKSHIQGQHTTTDKHMPIAHQKQSQWNAERFINWGKQIGHSTKTVIEHLLNSKAHHEQGYRTCLGLLNLAKQYSNEKLELACSYAVYHNTKSRKSIQSILKHELYVDFEAHITQSQVIVQHANIRGSHYYH